LVGSYKKPAFQQLTGFQKIPTNTAPKGLKKHLQKGKAQRRKIDTQKN
jgi:hypothetical protein